MNAQHSSASGPKLSLAPVPAPPPNGEKGEGFEHEGKWRRVSLEGCRDIGQGKIKTRMIGSANGPLAHGEIGGGSRAARLFGARGARRRAMSGPLSAAASQSSAALVEPDLADDFDEDEALAALHEASRRQRVFVAVMVLAALAGCWGIVWWSMEGGEAQPELASEDDAHPGDLVIVPERIPAPDDFERARAAESERTDDVVPRVELEGPAPSKKSRKTKPKSKSKPKPHKGASCVDVVKDAESAKQSRSWTRLVSLTRKKKCWPSAKEAAWTILRLEALFQDEDYKGCVAVGMKAPKGISKNPEVQKWIRNCKGRL